MAEGSRAEEGQDAGAAAGGSPYNRTPGAVDDLFRRLETTFTHLASRGVEGMTLTDFARFRAAARRGKSAGDVERFIARA